MIPAVSPAHLFAAIAAIGFCLAGAAPAAAQAMPDAANGRYALSPSGDGVIRLDTRTGAVSNCGKSEAGWACYTMPDERKALEDEIGRLETENAKLKAKLAEQSPASGPGSSGVLPKADKDAAPKVAEGERKIEIPLPSDADMDRFMSFLKGAWRRLVDMASQVQKEASGKI